MCVSWADVCFWLREGDGDGPLGQSVKPRGRVVLICTLDVAERRLPVDHDSGSDGVRDGAELGFVVAAPLHVTHGAGEGER